jgi:hypothetical protein
MYCSFPSMSTSESVSSSKSLETSEGSSSADEQRRLAMGMESEVA